MDHHHVVTFLGTIALILLVAKAMAELAERLGQPPVLGELLGGVLLGFGLIPTFNPNDAGLALMAEIGVLLLLLETGLESDLEQLLKAGPASIAVAVGGVVAPFAFGYLAMHLLGYPSVESVMVGAALTATSVGITARVLSDLGQIGRREAQIILGAAVIDDILGLIILSAVQGMAGGGASAGSIARTALMAFAFLALALWLGPRLAKGVVAWTRALRSRDAMVIVAICFAAGMAILAQAFGTAMIVGSFAAGILLACTDKKDEIHVALRPVSAIFVPIFFLMVGAKVDVSHYNPATSEGRSLLLIGGLLSLLAIVGKLGAGWLVKGKELNRWAIGAGMIPRGEVGLIFAQVGLAAGVIEKPLYAAIIGMVLVTTFVTPPLLKRFFTPGR